jgi:hypothetical protein
MNTALAGAYLAEEDKKRREGEGQTRQDNLLDTVGKIALAAGATAGAVVAGRRLAGGQNTSATFDLSKVAGEGARNLRRAAADKIAPQDVVPPSRPVPTTGVERQRQVVEDTIRARSERPQGVVTVNLPQPKTALDPWGVATVPPGPNIKEMSFVLGDLPEPTEAELAKVLPKTQEKSYPAAPLTRQQVFSSAAAKPESELPRVYKPQGSAEVDLITDPNTGEVFRRGQSPESFKETYIGLRPALTGQRTDLPEGRTPGTFAEFSQDVSGASAAGRLLEDPELLQLVRQQRRQEGAELGRESQRQSRIAAAVEQEADEVISSVRRQANTVQAAGQEDFANQYLRNEGYTQADTLVDQQVSSNLNQTDQFINAVNSAEDQQTGRVKLSFQRNEDENLAAIELAEDRVDAQLASMAQTSPESAGGIEVDAAINRVAAQRPDGMPVDQAEGFRAFSQRATQRKNLLDVQDQMWAFEEQMESQGQKAQTWLNKQLEIQKRREPVLDIENKVYNLVGKAAEQGVDLEPSRALTLLTNPTAELTGVEQRLFGIDPSLGKFALKGQTFEPGQRQTGASLSVLGERLEDIPNVGENPRSFVTQAASGTSIRGRSRIPNVPDESRARFSSSGRPVTADDVSIDEGGTVTVSPGEELTEMVFESKEPTYTRFVRNPQASEQRPAFFGPGLATAEQLKVGLSPEYAPKGMRAIQTKEGQPYFVPIGDPGGIGVYGEERRFASGPIVKFDDPEQERVAGAYTKTAMRAPTEMPFKEKQRGGAGFGDLSSQQLQSFIEKAPEGPMRLAGQKELAKRETTKQSLAASELFRRGRIEGLF